MVIERFKDQDPIPVYRRVRDPGIKFPEGLTYVGSWIEPNFDRCFQLMECDDLRLVRCSSAISPKNVPSESRTRWLGRSISTSPAVMKYIEEAGSPRRTSTSLDSMVCARNSRMISDISEAPRRENSGTRASMPQV